MTIKIHSPARIHVCSLAALNGVVTASGASHVLSVINPWSLPDTPPGIAKENHLKIAINDIEEEHEGLIVPNNGHISDILGFVARWERQQPLVIHCLAGISRSTAAAFITLCALNPDMDEVRLAKRLREASESASPNRRMINLADNLMGRNGHMIAAIETIGEAKEFLDAQAFSLSTSHN